MENTTKEMETNSFTLRLPRELDDAIQKDAKKEKRSKNSLIALILEKHLAEKSEQVEANN